MWSWAKQFEVPLTEGLNPFLRSSLNVLIILVLTWVALFLVKSGVMRFRAYMESRSVGNEEAKRVGTLCRAFRYVGSVVISIIAIMLILNELGISIAPILATAGVAGIAIGFGAQTLVKDYFAGLFLLVEDQIRQGDIVQIAGVGGVVEEVTLRYVRLRDYESHVHFVPNSEIKIVTNRTRDYAHTLIEIGVAYRENTDEALGVMREVAEAMRQDDAWRTRMLEEAEIVGVDRWADSAVILRCRIKVVGSEQWSVRREFLARLKKAYDAHGIEIPFPHMTIYPGVAKDGSAPALHLKSLQTPLSPPRSPPA